MKTRIANRLNMYKSEIDVCTANEPAWTAVPAFGGYLDELIAKVELLDVLAYKQMQSTVGVTAVKNKERKAVAVKAEVISSGLHSLAAATGNDELTEQLRFAFTDLTTGRSSRMLLLMDRIIELALAKAAALTAHGVTQQHIDEFISSRDHLEASVAKPRGAIVLRKMLTAQIQELVQDIDALLKNKLDKLVKVLRLAQPEFYLHYMAARTVVDHKGKSNKPGTTGTTPPSLPPPADADGTK